MTNKEKLELINSLFRDKDVWIEFDPEYVLVEYTDPKVRAVFEKLGVDIDEYYQQYGTHLDEHDKTMCLIPLANQYGAVAWDRVNGFADCIYDENSDVITIDAERFRRMERVIEAARDMINCGTPLYDGTMHKLIDALQELN